jgi:hypothetical protein
MITQLDQYQLDLQKQDFANGVLVDTATKSRLDAEGASAPNATQDPITIRRLNLCKATEYASNAASAVTRACAGEHDSLRVEMLSHAAERLREICLELAAALGESEYPCNQLLWLRCTPDEPRAKP